MSIEDRLTAELGRRADDLAPTRVEVEGLVRLGRRERRRRTTQAVLGAVAAVAAVVVGIAVLAPSSAPTGPEPVPAAPTSTPGPLDEPGQMPYLLDGTLVQGRTQVPVDPDWRLSHANGTTLVGRQWQGPWALVQDDGLVELPTGTTTEFGVILSDDGTRAAWVNEVDRTTQRVVVWDVAAGREADRIDVPAGPGPQQDLWLRGIDGDGRLIWTTRGLERPTLWTPGSDPVPITGLPEQVAQSTALGVIAGAVLGTLDDRGAFTALGPAAPGRSWSPDGTLQVLEGPGDSLRVEDVTTGEVTELRPRGVPLEGGAGPTAWTSPTEVWLVGLLADTSGKAIFRCDVTRGDCQLVDERVPNGAWYSDRTNT